MEQPHRHGVSTLQRVKELPMAEREKETIITTDGGGGGGGAILAVVLLIAVLVVLFLLFGRGMLGGADDATDINADVKVEAPSTN
jgi:uncharacterized membrane protein